MKNNFWFNAGMVMILLPAIVSSGTFFALRAITSQKTITINVENVELQNFHTDNEWDLFTASLIMVESNGNPNAVNSSSGAIGLFQILPLEGKGIGYLHDWNKYNKKQYTTQDLYNTDVQWEIFNFVQKRYNPHRDIDKAIEVHNSRAGEWYKARILNQMEKIRNYE